MISFFIAMTRAVEIIIKPVVAVISDSFSNKLGRRKPFMYAGCLFYSLFLVLLFYPPFIDSHFEDRIFTDYTLTNYLTTNNISFQTSPETLNQHLNINSSLQNTQSVFSIKFNEYANFLTKNNYSLKISLWFGVLYLLFFMADTICNIPYGALAPELSSNPKEREKLFFVYYLFQYIGILFSVAGPVILQYFIFHKCNFSVCDSKKGDAELYSMCMNLKQQMCNNTNNFNSLRAIAFYVSFHYLVSIALLGYYIKEKYIIDSSMKDNHRHFIPSLTNMLKNKPFISIILPYILDNIILAIFATMLPFYIKYVINPEEYCIYHKRRLNSIFCNSNLL